MARQPAISDAAVAGALGAYAGMVHHVVSDPARWLGLDDDPPPSASLVTRARARVRDGIFGEVSPASPNWGARPVSKRVDWWVKRIGLSAGLAAAAPRLAGALADRVPLQAALGGSAAGLAVCATALEHGVTTPDRWVPLLAKVLLDRDLGGEPGVVPPPAESERDLAAADQESDDQESDEQESVEQSGPMTRIGRGAQRAAKTLWQLARTFLELQNLLDERPRGNLLARGIAKVPVIGVAGGWVDERGGIRKAARQTARLIA